MSTVDQERFARLLTILKIHEAQVKANPVEYVNEIGERYCQLREAIELAIRELVGPIIIEDPGSIINTITPSEQAIDRNRKALNILRDAVRGEER